jgi:hypothetical protein
LYYEDNLYQTDGKLRIAISTNSSDDKNFNPPAFNISVSHNYQKSCNLNIQQATDLVQGFKKVLTNAAVEDAEIVRRISKNLELTFYFKLDQNQLPVVEIILRSSSTDFTKIIIPIDVFSVLAHRLKNFVNNFDQLCYQLLMKNIDGEYGEIIRQLPGLIRGISSQIIPAQIPEAGVVESEAGEEAPAAATIAELDNFLGPDLSNVNVPELESKQVKGEENVFSEVKSEFVEKIIEGKLENLENILVNIEADRQPIQVLNDYFIEGIGKDITYLPDLKDDELKSSLYISKLLYSLITQSHIKNSSPIPTSTPILKYKVKTIKDENLELAYDLLLIFAYTRNLRNRMSDKSSDFIVNKSNFYLQMRCYLDVFCFSFLEKSNKTQLSSVINNRYKYYDSIGVFDYYKDLLKKHNCSDINAIDIDTFVDEVCEKVIGKSMYITEQHDNLVETNSFRLPSKNNFTLEQITNEVIPLEVGEKMGVTIQDPEAVKYASAEVINWFSDQGEPKVTKTKKEKTSNIIRFVTHYRNEIPEQHREGFLEWLKSEVDKNFSFSDCEFPLAEFGGNVIKGLYLWKPLDDGKLLTNYKYFWTQFEDCMLDKNHILALDEKVEDEKSDEWSNAFDNITFE